MSVMKTYKNPYVIESEVQSDPHIVIYSVQETLFSSEDWDMEITLTRKPKPIEVGQHVEVYDDETYPWQGTVVWFDSRFALIDKSYGVPKVVKREHIGL